MATDSIREALLTAREILVDLERHIDRAAMLHTLPDFREARTRAEQLLEVLRTAERAAEQP